jgi:hypothetical protein
LFEQFALFLSSEKFYLRDKFHAVSILYIQIIEKYTGGGISSPRLKAGVYMPNIG